MDFGKSLFGISLKSLIDQKIKAPDLFEVVLLNDHFTSMDFVITVLKSIFNKSENDATALMLEIHTKGAGIAGVYTFDIASTKATQVHKMAKTQGYPLKCVVDKA